MMKIGKLVSTLICVSFLGGGSASAAVLQIGLNDYNDAVVVDFESAAAGAISALDPLFADAGIGSIAVAGSVVASTDVYNGGGVDKGLFFNSQLGLFVDDLGGVNRRLDFIDSWVVGLNDHHHRFGMSVLDTSGNFQFDFLSNGVVVDSGRFFAGPAPAVTYLESGRAFNEVRITHLDHTDGWGLDNITLERVVPAPGALGVLLLGLAAMSAERLLGRRRLG